MQSSASKAAGVMTPGSRIVSLEPETEVRFSGKERSLLRQLATNLKDERRA
jgi:hypothetical protein